MLYVFFIVFILTPKFCVFLLSRTAPGSLFKNSIDSKAKNTKEENPI